MKDMKRFGNTLYHNFSEIVIMKNGCLIEIETPKSKQDVIFKSENMELVDEEDFQFALNEIKANLEKQEEKAIHVVRELFEKKKDKAGQDYFNHLKTVSENTKTVKASVVGLLHDVIEDTNFTKEDLLNLGFDEDIVDSVVKLTKKEDQVYLEYIKNIVESNNVYAIDVKISDLKHNTDLTRIKNVSDEDLKRNDKYLKALNKVQRRWEQWGI